MNRALVTSYEFTAAASMQPLYLDMKVSISFHK